MTEGKTIKIIKIERGIDYITGKRKETNIDIIIDNNIDIERKALQMTVESPSSQVRNKNVRNESGSLVLSRLRGISVGSGERSITKYLFDEKVKRIEGTNINDYRRCCFK